MNDLVVFSEIDKQMAAATEVDMAVWGTLRDSIYPGAKPESIAMVVNYCKSRNLDPVKKPVHIVPMSIKMPDGKYKTRDVIMPGIGEARTTAARTKQYAGKTEPVFGPKEKFEFPIKEWDDQSRKYIDQGKVDTIMAPSTCTVTVKRIVDGVVCSWTNTERFEEIVGLKKNGEVNSMWRRRPCGQFAKCTEAGGLRQAFPEEMGETYVREEMENRIIDSTAEEIHPPITPPKEKDTVPPSVDVPTKPAEGVMLIPASGVKMMKSKMKASSITDAEFCVAMKIDCLENLPADRATEAIHWINSPK